MADNSNSLGTGLMAVFAVSGSVALLAMQVHKRLLSDFMKKMEFEIGSSKKLNQSKNKKVRFADSVEKLKYPSSSDYCKADQAKKNDLHSRAGPSSNVIEEKLENLPLNWQALYKGIIQYRVLKGHY